MIGLIGALSFTGLGSSLRMKVTKSCGGEENKLNEGWSSHTQHNSPIICWALAQRLAPDLL